MILKLKITREDDFYNEKLDVAPAFKYFGVADGGNCADAIGSDEDRFIQCRRGQGTFYNPRHDVLLYAHSNAAYSAIEGESLSTRFLQEDMIPEKIEFFREEHPSEEDKIWALDNHKRFDDVFIFMEDGQERMTVSREKVHDIRDIDENRFGYLVTVGMHGVDVDEEFSTEYAEVVSPLDHTRPLRPSDMFNLTYPGTENQKSVVVEDGDSVYALSVTDYANNDLYRNWFVYTGRLRGELELPPRD